MTRLLYVQGVPIWRNVVALRWIVQIVSAVVVLSTIALFLLNVAREIEARDIPFGFTFLDRAAQIPIGEAVIPYDPSDSYLYGLLVAGTQHDQGVGSGGHPGHGHRHPRRSGSLVAQLAAKPNSARLHRGLPQHSRLSSSCSSG